MLPLSRRLTVQGMELTIPCAGQNYVGIGIGVTGDSWSSGTIQFWGSLNGSSDGWFLQNMIPYPNGTPNSIATTASNWFTQCGNLVLIRAVLTTAGTGIPTVQACVSQDGSFADAFLTPSQINRVSVGTANAQNQMTIPLDANRPWLLRTLTITTSGGAPSGTVQIKDGATLLYQADIQSSVAPARVRDGIVTIPVPLPSNAFPMAGLIGTPNQAMTITVSALGQYVISTIDAETHAA